MPTTASEFQAKVDTTIANMDRFDLLVNGDEATDVALSSGDDAPSWLKLQTQFSERIAQAIEEADIGGAAALAINGKLATVLSQLSEPGVIGITGNPQSATPNIGTNTIVFDSPVTRDGQVVGIRLYSKSSDGFTLSLKRFTRSGDAFTQVGSNVELAVPAGVGSKTIELPNWMPLNINEYIGFYVPAGSLTYTTNSPYTPYYAGAGNVSNFTDASITNNLHLQIGFDISYAAITSEIITQIEADVAAAAEDAALARSITDYILVDEVIGRTGTPVAGSPAGNRTYVLGNGLAGTGYLDNLSLYASNPGTIAVKRFTREGNTFTQVGSDLPLTVVAGANSFSKTDLAALSFESGEYPGIYFPSSVLSFTTNAAEGNGWYSSEANTGSVSEFTDTLASTAQRLEVGFRFKVLNTGGNSGPQPGGPSTATALQSSHRGCVGIHGYGARMALPFDNTVPKTFWMCIAAPAHFDAIRVVFGHSTTNGDMTIAKASIATLASLAATTGATSHTNPIPVTFDGGNVGATLGVSPSTTDRTLLKSDLIPISSIARTDGTFPLLTVMAYISSPRQLKLIGKSDATTDMTSWATEPDMPMIYRYNNGDCVASPSSFTSTVNRSTGPILGIEFVARGQVITTMVFADSISNGEGQGIARNGLNYGFRTAFNMNELGGICHSHFNAAWSGTKTSGFAARMRTVFEAGLLPDVAFIQAFSPNDIDGGVITDANIDAMKQNLAAQVDLCRSYDVRPVILTGLPVSLANYQATDLKRQAFNTILRGYAQRGIQVLDFDAVAREAVPDGNGRYEFKAGASDDLIHPNDSLVAEFAALAETAIGNLALNWTGALVTT